MSSHLGPAHPTRHVSPWSLVRDVAVVLLAFAVVGAIAGVVWETWWTAPTGVVQQGGWYLDSIEVRGMFSATAEYVVVGLVAGLLVGAVSAYVVDRVELVTLLAVVVGSVLGGWLMLLVGTAMAPPDPAVLARSAADGTVLPGTVDVAGRWALGALPAGALAGLAAVYIGLTSTRRSRG